MQFDKETQTRILRVASDRQHGRDLEELDERSAHVMDLPPEFEEIWAAAGTPDSVFPIQPKELVKATSGAVVAVTR